MELRDVEARHKCPLCGMQLTASHYVAHLRHQHGATLSNSVIGVAHVNAASSAATKCESARKPIARTTISMEPPPMSAAASRAVARQATVRGPRQTTRTDRNDPLLSPQPPAKSEDTESRAVTLRVGRQVTLRCHVCGVVVRRDRLKHHLQKVHNDGSAPPLTSEALEREPKRIRVERSTRRKRGRVLLQCDKCGEAMQRGISTKRSGLLCFQCAGMGKKAKVRRMGGDSTSIRTISTPTGGQPKWKR